LGLRLDVYFCSFYQPSSLSCLYLIFAFFIIRSLCGFAFDGDIEGDGDDGGGWRAQYNNPMMNYWYSLPLPYLKLTSMPWYSV